MSNPVHHQSALYEALGEALEDAETPAFMSAEKEAVALVVMAQRVVALLEAGECPVVKLMALSQQALRCSAIALTQDASRPAAPWVSSDLLTRALPS